MLTRADISSLSSASQARTALMEVRKREVGETVIAARLSGPRYQTESQSKKIPLVDQTGKPFAAPIIGTSKTLNLPADLQQGSLIEYQDTLTGEYYYAKVSKNNLKKDRIEVENLSKSQAEELVKTNPQTKVYEVSEKDLSSSEKKSVIATLMSLLDPSENVVFKLLTLLLVGNIFKTDSMADVFMGVYIRIVALAIGIIIVIYASTVIFT